MTEDDGKIMSIEYKEVSNSARNKYDKKVRRVNQRSILIIWVDPNKQLSSVNEKFYVWTGPELFISTICLSRIFSAILVSNGRPQ